MLCNQNPSIQVLHKRNIGIKRIRILQQASLVLEKVMKYTEIPVKPELRLHRLNGLINQVQRV